MLTVVIALFASIVAVPQGAVAGPGSLVSGSVWADANSDGSRTAATEPLRAGVTVQLLTSPVGAVVATTTTSSAGAYAFSNTADGDYIVRVDAPPGFRFPDVRSGANDFARAGAPAAGQPERGVSLPLTIAGATQVRNVDAGLQPLRSLQVAQLALSDACAGTTQTGTPPFDGVEGPGLDTGTGNCIVRTGDTVRQQFGVSLNGPGGTTVNNVMLELTVSSPNGGVPGLVGTGPGSTPDACLGAAAGAVPPSSTRTNADGSVTILCNLGPAASTVTVIDFYYRAAAQSPVPSEFVVTARAYAPEGDATSSNTTTGPTVTVTGDAQWDIAKRRYPSNANNTAGPTYIDLDVPGVGVLPGYWVRYQFDMTDTSPGGFGSGQLDWPVTFTDSLPGFPNARIMDCRNTNNSDDSLRSWWRLTCPPVTETQGTDGWQVSVRPDPTLGSTPPIDYTQGHMVMQVFLPVEDVNRHIDPDWQPGEPTPVGAFSFDNIAEDTEGWTMDGGQPNTGENPANNSATVGATSQAPRWDLSKTQSAISYEVRDLSAFGGGTSVPGYTVLFIMSVQDLAGAGNMAPWLDRPVEFTDRFVSHPGAYLISCTTRAIGNRGATAIPTCETGLQPADGWDMSLVPTDWGFEARRGDFWVTSFIPLDAMTVDPCNTTSPQIHIRNEVIDSDGWTAGGPENLNNGTGFEPGWDGTTATGNNLVDRNQAIQPSSCGVYNAAKRWANEPTAFVFAGSQRDTFVTTSGSNDRVAVPDLTMCDVFDVSVVGMTANRYGAGVHTQLAATGNAVLSDYIVEFAQGPNETRTQAPTDFTSLQNAARGCNTHTGPWETDPAAFGADWQDTVNMIRVRPIDPDHVQNGPFTLTINAALTGRGTYNGGPNAGEPIPDGILATNVGSWTPRGSNPDVAGPLDVSTRQIPFRGMRLHIEKTPVQAQYLPGNTAIWNIGAALTQVTAGAVMENVRIVDTLPPDLAFDAACTQSRLPANVTMSYDPNTRAVTFFFGDITATVTGTNWFVGRGTLPPLQVCTTVPTLAQPGDLHRNNVQAFGDGSVNEPTATAQVQITGSGQLGVTKGVDRSLVASGETFTWAVEWGNTSTTVSFLAPDLIDVLPWNGDGEPGSLSRRAQLPSDYSGVVELTGPLSSPTYVRHSDAASVGTAVPGTWYYSTAASETVNHDPRVPANANPEAPGGLWLTGAEVADYADVTAVRFVHSEALPPQSRAAVGIPMVATSSQLGNVYVNRAVIASATVPDQPLMSGEPYVLMPGFTLGDLVFIDRNGNGRFGSGESGVAGVTVQVRDEAGDVVATLTTNAQGRWSAENLFAGTYTVHIPATMFAPGGPLADHVVRTAGSSTNPGLNEGVDNNNTATVNPLNSGLTSSPITLSNVRNAQGILTGGDGPTGDDVARLGDSLLPDSFTNFTVDLALMPAPDVEIEKATNGIDADTASGPNVTVGGAVRWTYVVTNSGGVALTDVTVTDDKVDAADIDCRSTGSNVIALLAVGATATCVATGVAETGQYENTGHVVGSDPTGVTVDDEDASHYFGTEPSIDIEKATNGRDADTST
ncbi:MAG: SdrD B-like domain-containing protein, partial [Microbacterium sp.]